MSGALNPGSSGWDSESGALLEQPIAPAVTEFQRLPRAFHWFALATRSRHEKKVLALLEAKGIETFLPLLSQLHRWSDRKKLVRVPLFPGYLFVRLDGTVETRGRALEARGIVGFVGSGGRGLPIPDKQIEDIQTVLASQAPCALFPFLRAGQRVRIRGGCLDGIEGLLVARNDDRSLVISVEPILQSVAIRIEGYEIEVLAPPRSSAA
jgi:transcription termination/antitermination protein NusG